MKVRSTEDLESTVCCNVAGSSKDLEGSACSTVTTNDEIISPVVIRVEEVIAVRPSTNLGGVGENTSPSESTGTVGGENLIGRAVTSWPSVGDGVELGGADVS